MIASGDPPHILGDSVTSSPRILVADDQQDVLEALRLLLKSEGFTLETAGSPAAAWAALEGREFDVALIDLNYTRDTTSGQEGMDLLARIRELDETLPVVVMTAWASVSLAVEAMRNGARDFVSKPWENARLIAILRTQAELVEGPASRPTARKREPGAARRNQARSHRRIAEHEEGHGHGSEGRAFRRQHSSARRKRIGEGHGRPGAPFGIDPEAARPS